MARAVSPMRAWLCCPEKAEGAGNKNEQRARNIWRVGTSLMWNWSSTTCHRIRNTCIKLMQHASEQTCRRPGRRRNTRRHSHLLKTYRCGSKTAHPLENHDARTLTHTASSKHQNFTTDFKITKSLRQALRHLSLDGLLLSRSGSDLQMMAGICRNPKKAWCRLFPSQRGALSKATPVFPRSFHMCQIRALLPQRSHIFWEFGWKGDFAMMFDDVFIFFNFIVNTVGGWALLRIQMYSSMRCAMRMRVLPKCKMQGLGYRETLCFAGFGSPPMAMLQFRPGFLSSRVAMRTRICQRM